VGLGVHSTPSPTGGIRRLETSREGRRTAIVIALVLVCCSIAFVACAALVLLRFGKLYPVDVRWLLYLSTAFPVLLQLWGAYFVYLQAHTALEFSLVGLRLTRPLPFRAWSGPWRDVRQFYLHKGLFAIRTTERLWPGWAIKVAPSDALLVEELKRYLGPGVWRDPHARLRFAGRILILVHAILFGLALLVYFLEKAFR
jgi:hypothetical protein